MPLISNVTRRKKGGSGAGKGIFVWYATQLQNYREDIPHPNPGYIGPVDIALCGISSGPGTFWSPDQYGGTQGSGQSALWTYQMLGDEFNFTIIQEGMGQTIGILKLQVNGGLNNGSTFAVGSGMPGNNYGAAMAATDRISATNAVGAVQKFSGACRPYNSTIYYSDNTQYNPYPPPSYGNTQATYNYAGGTKSIVLFGQTSPGGIQVNSGGGPVARYGYAGCTNPSPWSGTVVPGGVVFAFPD